MNGGKSQIVSPPDIRKAAPPDASHTPNVTIKAGIPRRETNEPLKEPTAIPNSNVTAIGPTGTAVVPVISRAPRIRLISATPPTDTSMPAVRMTNV